MLHRDCSTKWKMNEERLVSVQIRKAIPVVASLNNRFDRCMAAIFTLPL
jgi:hypothetical protein